MMMYFVKKTKLSKKKQARKSFVSFFDKFQKEKN